MLLSTQLAQCRPTTAIARCVCPIAVFMCFVLETVPPLCNILWRCCKQSHSPLDQGLRAASKEVGTLRRARQILRFPAPASRPEFPTWTASSLREGLNSWPKCIEATQTLQPQPKNLLPSKHRHIKSICRYSWRASVGSSQFAMTWTLGRIMHPVNHSCEIRMLNILESLPLIWTRKWSVVQKIPRVTNYTKSESLLTF